MSDTLRCSVVIPTYDRATLLGHTLAALARQSLPRTQFEVLVADDGSTDNTADVVAGFRDRLDVTYLRQEHDGVGAGRARNMGIGAARGDVCVMIDSGVLPHSGCLAAHVAAHDAAPGPVAVIGYVYGFSLDGDDAELEQLIDVHDADATIERMAAEPLHGDVRDLFYRRYDDDFADLPAPWVMFWTCNVSARTAQLRDVGMFDEHFRTWGGEDLDLAYRLHCADARFVLDRAASSVHVPHKKNFEASLASAHGNYQYMITKYQSPLMPLLLATPTINPFNINDVIPVLDLPPDAGKSDRKQADA
ncbi:glycosyltransferase [Micromonospora sp. NPDC048999]|uniref:glycosyltransferase family 2 protein n=1 Tax=Micromonospora sp. NPDC048999 TaxID=3155391 RepID=UPI0033F39A53